MLRIKRLDTFVLQNFLPTFLMTFFICDFILVMQFVWRVADDIMGKGIEFYVYLQFFYYVSASLLPTTLPLAILLASLMTFGNFGERLELLAMKAAGVSLFRIMRPLILTVTVIAGLSFLFEDAYLPKVQLKLNSLMYGMQEKSPALSIPEGAFYSEIENMTIYVRSKDVEKKMLKDIMIYDFSEGFEKVSVTLADSGFLQMTEDKCNLVMTLYHGEGFSNFDQQTANTKGVPYRREMFRRKEIIIPFDDNFRALDEDRLRSNHMSRNCKELRSDLDSLQAIIDTAYVRKQRIYVNNHYMGRERVTGYHLLTVDSMQRVSTVPLFNVNVDSMFASLSAERAQAVLDKAIDKVDNAKNDFVYQESSLNRETYKYRRSGIEYYKKYSLSIACLVFFFIGAPLGAIIRKGGIGMPAVLSVVLFIVYYLIDTAGQKLIKSGEWPAVMGMSLSTLVLLPLGLFLTYKSVNDSAIFNSESYLSVIKRIFRPKLMYRYVRYVFRYYRKHGFGHQAQ